MRELFFDFEILLRRIHVDTPTQVEGTEAVLEGSSCDSLEDVQTVGRTDQEGDRLAARREHEGVHRQPDRETNEKAIIPEDHHCPGQSMSPGHPC